MSQMISSRTNLIYGTTFKFVAQSDLIVLTNSNQCSFDSSSHCTITVKQYGELKIDHFIYEICAWNTYMDDALFLQCPL